MRVFTTIQPKEATHIPEPPIARFLFADTRMAWFWLLVRLYVGYQLLTAGLDKLTGHSFTLDASFGTSVGTPWVFGAHDGAALKGFVAGALAHATGAHPTKAGMPPSYSWWCCPTPRSLPTWSPSVRCSLGSVCSWGC